MKVNITSILDLKIGIRICLYLDKVATSINQGLIIGRVMCLLFKVSSYFLLYFIACLLYYI